MQEKKGNNKLNISLISSFFLKFFFLEEQSSENRVQDRIRKFSSSVVSLTEMISSQLKLDSSFRYRIRAPEGF